MNAAKRARWGFLALCCLLGGSSGTVSAWVWADKESSVLPSLQEEFDQEVAGYRSRTEKGMQLQERLIELDRLISQYKPQGINTVVLESERDRLTVQMDKERQSSQSALKLSSDLYQLTLQKTNEGRFIDALSAIQKAERLVPEDAAFKETRRKLEVVTAIIPSAFQGGKTDSLVRKGVLRFLENDGIRSLNALRYASNISPGRAELNRLSKLVEKEYPDLTVPPASKNKTLVDYKLQLALEYVYDGHYLKSIEECNQVLDLESNNVLALTRMGSAYYAMGQKQEARDLWTRALKIEPGNQVLKDFLKDKF